MDINTLLLLLAIGAFAGIASGFVGVGGGLILVPAMVVFLGLGQHAAQGTSLAMMLPPVGILAVMQYHKAGKFIGRTRPFCASPSWQGLGAGPN